MCRVTRTTFDPQGEYAWDFISKCPFCGCQPFDYVEAKGGPGVAVKCCDVLVDFFAANCRFPSVFEAQKMRKADSST